MLPLGLMSSFIFVPSLVVMVVSLKWFQGLGHIPGFNF